MSNVRAYQYSNYDGQHNLDVAHEYENVAYEMRLNQKKEPIGKSSSKVKFLLRSLVIIGLALMSIGFLKFAGYLKIGMVGAMSFIGAGELLAVGAWTTLVGMRKDRTKDRSIVQLESIANGEEDGKLEVENLAKKLWKSFMYKAFNKPDMIDFSDLNAQNAE